VDSLKPPMTAPLMLWAFAKPDDPARDMLKERGDTRLVVGSTVAEFVSAPRPDVVLVCGPFRDLLQALLPGLPDLRWVHLRSAGIEGVLCPELNRPGLVVTNGRGVFSAALAEFAIGALLYFAKDFRRLVRQQQEGTWETYEPQMLSGRNLGIVGFGDIGRQVAQRGKALGMNIRALRRRVDSSPVDPVVDEMFPTGRLRELLSASDDVVVSTPLTEETRGLIGPAELAVLKPTSVIVNIGRGPVVHEAALVESLRAKRIRGAALDVFDREPLPSGHPLYGLENVLLSPHCADHVPGWLDQAMSSFWLNLARFRAGAPLESLVDPSQGY
jgi:phosphoglycerate dehydrogenase-like enzyme